MNIAIIGLGLIGGSMLKSIKEKTNHKVFVFDKDETIIKKAKEQILTNDNLKECDIVLIALYPKDTINFIKTHSGDFKKSAIVSDLCGVKQIVCDSVLPVVKLCDFTFIGAHPMAGIEKTGFDNSLSTMFDGATIILTPFPDTDEKEIKVLSDLYKQTGFSNIQFSTPSEHDKMISYTSQLAHVVSNAYVKSPGAKNHHGYSAGSYKDLTRVARLNEVMWTELFLENKENLVNEIDSLIDNLSKYSDALKTEDERKLNSLLKEGREIKEQVDKYGE